MNPTMDTLYSTCNIVLKKGIIKKSVFESPPYNYIHFTTLGQPTSSATSTLSSSNMLQQNNTANGIGHQMSLPIDDNTTFAGNILKLLEFYFILRYIILII